MALTKWTPGPWLAKDYGVFAGRNCIATTDTDNDVLARYEANARLMAAAPDLYAALEQAAEIIRERDDGNHDIRWADPEMMDAWVSARAALAKAGAA